MQKALSSNGTPENAIRSVPEDKTVSNFRNEILNDYSIPQAEYKHCLFPVHQLLDPAVWRREFNKSWQHSEEKSKLFDDFEKAVIDRFKQYLVPVILP